MAKRGRKRKRKNVVAQLHLKRDTLSSIIFVIFIVLSLISVFSFLQIGTITIKFNEIIVSYFGIGAIAFPFLLFLIALMFGKINTPLKDLNIFLGFLLIFSSTLSVFKQGILGNFLWEQFSILFSELISLLIFVSGLIVGFIILFDTSITQIINFFIKIINFFKKNIWGTNNKIKENNNAFNSIFNLPQKEDSRFDLKENKEDNKNMEVVGVKPVFTQQKIGSQNTPMENKIWEYPSIDIFEDAPGIKADRGDVRKHAQIIEQTLDSFGITARVVDINNSPSVTQYALEVALGTKLAKIVNLSNDLAMALAAPGGQIRVEAPIPGKNRVGIEVPNRSLEVVPVRKLMESDIVKNSKNKLLVPLGLDVAGQPTIGNISKMPHVLIAGQTGSGKSVCINSWITSLIYRNSPEELKLILVDPKRVELTPYNGIPHLYTPVITDPEEVVSALKWAVSEMERRYKLFTSVNAKNIDIYNEISGFQSIPYIVIIVDEMAEVMMFSPSQVEENVCRLAQMARAVGIHLVLATQRPSVNVITGLIKANIPTRMSFAVSSMTDSRVILDSVGAEKLLGRGDMLYIPPDLAKPVRIQGCFVSDKEINRVINYVKTQRSENYDNAITNQEIANPNSLSKNSMIVGGAEQDSLFNDAMKIIADSGNASASFLQRKLKIGYARAARILDELQQAKIIGPANGSKPRDILISHNKSSNNTG